MDLQTVLSFMYQGEVNVARQELSSFLSVAADLQVKGLTQHSPGENYSSWGPPQPGQLSQQPAAAAAQISPPPPPPPPPASRLVGGPPAKRPRQDPPDIERKDNEEEEEESKGSSPDPADFLHQNHIEEEEEIEGEEDVKLQQVERAAPIKPEPDDDGYSNMRQRMTRMLLPEVAAPAYGEETHKVPLRSSQNIPRGCITMTDQEVEDEAAEELLMVRGDNHINDEHHHLQLDKFTGGAPVADLDNTKDYPDFLEEAMRSNCTKIEGGYSCRLCEKICRDLTRARQHLEAKHFPSLGYSCPQCGKHCKTKHALTCHISVYHRENASPT